MTIDTTKLRELAQKATPGPWTYISFDGNEHHVLTPVEGLDMTMPLCFPRGVQTYRPKDDAEFIASANPAAVLALLDELTRTQGSVAIASAALSAAEREVQRLRTIEAAARNMVKVKGRHHSEIAYQKLVEVLG